MKGFFTIDKPVTAPPRTSCGGTCTLNKGCRSPKMPVTGQGRMKILVVAEAPGKEEDLQNTQLIGPAGQLLRDALAEFGIDLNRDCRKTNSCRCRPPENRRPTNQEIIACQTHLWDEIKEHPPKLILLLGQVAVESFLSGRVKSPGQIGRWRGFVIPDQKAQAWVAPTFHPSYILRSQEGRAIRGRVQPILAIEERVFMDDLEHALAYLKKPFPVAPTPNVEILQGDQISSVRLPAKDTTIAIDYETTGLRPWQRKDHRIVSVGVAWDGGAFSFAMSPVVAPLWKKVLADPKIKKVFWNMKFECQWALHCLGTETKGCLWDGMLASHILDNRRGICGLKHQVYLNFGVEDWSGGIEFDSDEENNVRSPYEPTEELLKYNAADSFWTFLLYKKQRALFQ
jgi:uracil-DNA glycosylase family 4